jgi:2-dehydro-3-deoxyphosphogluconate aldolase/(4S)-4-hydroxy-2-oxoglutarate aldolase
VNREEICYKIREVGVIPSVRVKSADLALFAVEFIAAGGIPIAEIAATIPGSTALIADIRQRFPAVITGAEALSLRDAERQFEAGAQFLTAPAFQPEIAVFCRQHDCGFIPGALTPTEILAAHQSGADFVKVFPVGEVGGEKYIRALKAPLPQVALIAAGGVTQSAAMAYIHAGAAALGVGEDLIPRQALRFREGAWIRELALRFRKFVEQARNPQH